MRKPVVGWEGFYEVSDQGDVFSLERTVTRADGSIQRWPGRRMNPMSHNGYKIVRLSRPDVRTCALVHRLVAIAFIPNPEGKPEVNHKNGVRSDASLGNLEWVTSSENRKHAVHVLRSVVVPHYHGEKANGAKLTDATVVACRKAHLGGATIKGLARSHGIHKKTMQDILRGRRWVHVALPQPPTSEGEVAR